MRNSIFFALSIFILLLGPSAANENAAPLTQDEAKRFVDSLAQVEATAKEIGENEKIDNFKFDTIPKAGEKFQPYSRAVNAIKARSPADHAKLANAVKPHGFTTAQWGRVGDRVMVAYLALKMGEEDPRTMEMLTGFDRSMLDMIPVEMRAQVEASFAMLETVKNVPDQDKVTVKSVKKELDAYMISRTTQAE